MDESWCPTHKNSVDMDLKRTNPEPDDENHAAYFDDEEFAYFDDKEDVSFDETDVDYHDNSTGDEVCNMEQPLPFITRDTEGSMKINEQVVEELKKITGPVYVIAIVGKYRTGKSFIMNRLFDCNAGFKLGHTVQSMTKGIWIWAKPHPEHPEDTLILLDTEGLYDVEKTDDSHDMKLFSLTILLCKSLVYNAVGILDETMIHELHMVTELSDYIQTKKKHDDGDNGDDGDDENFHKYFPALFLLLRDFYLDLAVDGHACSATEYMEKVLRQREGNTPKVQKYNLPRACITQYFHKRQCLTLCKPVEGEEKMKSIDSISDEEFRPTFLNQAKTVIDVLIKSVEPFILEGNIITGLRFVELAQEYITMINGGVIPCITGAVETMKQRECERFLEEAVTIHDDIVVRFTSTEGGYPLENDNIQMILNAASHCATEHLEQKATFDCDGIYINKLMQTIEEKAQQILSKNCIESEHKCNQLLESSFSMVNKHVNDSRYTKSGGYDTYRQDKDRAISEYRKSENKGPMAEEMLIKYLELKNPEEEVIRNANKVITEQSVKLKEEQGAKQKLLSRIEETEIKHRCLEENLTRKTRNYDEKITEMKETISNERAHAREQAALDLRQQQITDYTSALNYERERSDKIYRGRVESLESQVENLHFKLRAADRRESERKMEMQNRNTTPPRRHMLALMPP